MTPHLRCTSDLAEAVHRIIMSCIETMQRVTIVYSFDGLSLIEMLRLLQPQQYIDLMVGIVSQFSTWCCVATRCLM